MMVRDRYTRRVPKDVIVPRTSLRLLNLVGQGTTLSVHTDGHPPA